MGRVKDLTGMKFGRLTVISLNEEITRQKKRAYWNCKCECGNEIIARGDSLRSGNTMSCACYKDEMSSKKFKEKWKDEEFRQKQRNVMREMVKEQWKDEEFRQMQRNGIKEKWQDEEFRQKQSNKMKEQWENEEMKWKMHYKGGISPISIYLRSLNSQWFEDCKQKANYTCQLTGKHGGNLNTHHLKAFSTIVIEAHNLHNIQIKDQVKDYTQEELKLLEEYVESWHKDNSNGVVLSEDVHKLFHSLYGKGDNTKEQYEEFKQRYLNGEFKEIVK